ncbi:MAG: fatty acid desaturase family protein [Acidobacteriota bacterium]
MTTGVQTVPRTTEEIEDLAPRERAGGDAAGVGALQEAGNGPSGDGEDRASFPKVLRQRLEEHFTGQGISPKADRAMWVKIVAGLALLAGSWIAIYAVKMGSGAFVALYVLGGLAQTFLLLNIAHDSNHNAISSRSWVNKTLNYVFDLCGISSYMWRILHHRGHHSCINIQGEDDALTGRGLLRFTPHEPRTRLQRFQHIYALGLYAIFSLDYVFVRDFECFFFPGHDYLRRTRHPAREYVILLAGKAIYVTYMLILPVLVLGRSAWLVAGAFLLVHLIVGLSVALVFQTTHTVESTHFPASRDEFENGVYHIFATTADYATSNPVVGWLTGGLNHHVAHHLCPYVCHTHYDPLTRIVERTAAEFGIPYRRNRTMTGAIRQHLTLLRQLGQAD